MPAARQDRRRARTRAKLVAATRRVIADKGVARATIATIAESADVGFGSFYNHFESKDDAIEAVATEVVDELGADLDALTATTEDPAEVVSASLRHTIARVDVDPVWAWFVVRAAITHRVMTTVGGGRILRDLRRGVEAGRFDPELHGVAPVAIGAIVQAAMRARLEGLVDEHTPAAVAEQVLRLLGVPSEEAAAVAARPLPELRHE
ncbi:MAG: TetR/AcrR family transcriptional regulator [Actinomycetota bacterium]